MSKILAFLKDLTVGKRIIAGFSLLTFLLIAVAVAGYATVGSIAEATAQTLRVTSRINESATRLRYHLSDLRRYEKDSFMNIGKAAAAGYETKWNAQYDGFLEELAELRPLLTTDADRAKLATIQGEFPKYESGFRTVLARIKDRQLKEADEENAAMEGVKAHVHAVESALIALSDEQLKIMGSVPDQVERQAARTKTTNVALGILAALIATVVSLVLTRGITRPLDALVREAKRSEE